MKTIILKPNDSSVVIPDRSIVTVVDRLSGARRSSGLKGKKLSLTIGRHCQVQYITIRTGIVESVIPEIRQIFLGDYSRLDSYFAYFGIGSGKFKMVSHLGKKTEMNSRVIFYQTVTDSLEVNDDYVFKDIDSRGRFSVTGILNEQASVKYYSDVIIDRLAQGTDSRIDMQLCLLGQAARGIILPGLKINANEVKAGHGASTFQLTPEDLFYLQARGLDEVQAKELLINSLVGRFTSELNDDQLKQLILKEINRKKLK